MANGSGSGSGSGDHDGTIYYLCPDLDTPSGGIRILYRHVDILNASGRPASVLHNAPGFRCTWFPSAARTRVAAIPEVVLDPRRDILAVPEGYGPDIGEMAGSVPKVVFNQNAYYTFVHYSADPLALKEDRPGRTPYLAAGTDGSDVLGALLISPDTERYLLWAFPSLPVIRIADSIDTDLFRYAPMGHKRPLLAYMPRKAGADALQVLNILTFRGVLDDLEVVPIDDATPAGVAYVLERAPIFLCFSGYEGYPIPPREAMACGCLVVGYHGFGGQDFFDPSWSMPIPFGDVQAFARAAEEAIRSWRDDPTPSGVVACMGRRAAAFVRRAYPPAREERELLAAWDVWQTRARALRQRRAAILTGSNWTSPSTP